MKSYTDLEQSKKLAEFLPLESADMEYLTIKENGVLVSSVPFVKDDSEVEDSAYSHIYDRIHCWSFAALFNVIPEGIIENYYIPNIQKENGKYSIAYGNEELLCEADNPVDVKLNEQNIL